MKNTLRVIEPFFTAEAGDTFVLTENGNYASQRNEEFHKAGESSELNAQYSSTFSISPQYAKQLIKEGYLEEIQKDSDCKFVNVFDEINNLIVKYENDLKNVEDTMKDAPQCLKVEKTTVLTNILEVLNYLKSLKK